MRRLIRLPKSSEPSGRDPWIGAMRLAAVVALSVCGVSIQAQELPAPAAQPEAPASPEPKRELANPYDPTVPVGVVRSYIDACREQDFETAAGFLVLDSVAPAERGTIGPRLAARLKTVLDTKLWVQYELLSDRPEGDLEDGLPPDLERLGTIGDVEVLLERTVNKKGEHIWKFSSGTVRSSQPTEPNLGAGASLMTKRSRRDVRYDSPTPRGPESRCDDGRSSQMPGFSNISGSRRSPKTAD